MKNKKFEWSNNFTPPSPFFLILSITVLVTCLVVSQFSSVRPMTCMIIALPIYCTVIGGLYIVQSLRDSRAKRNNEFEEEQVAYIKELFQQTIDIPYAIMHRSGNITLSNNAFSKLFGTQSLVFPGNVSKVCGISVDALLPSEEKSVAQADLATGISLPDADLSKDSDDAVFAIGGGFYRVLTYPIVVKGERLAMVLFDDVTELKLKEQFMHDQHIAVGQIVMDNIEDIAHYVRSNYQDELRTVVHKLSKWVTDMGGVICEYETNKFMIFVPQKSLDEAVAANFPILSDVRSVQIGDTNLSITVSIGISLAGNDIYERRQDAMRALNLAMQRGGDQIALKRSTGEVVYFGGITKASQSRSHNSIRSFYSLLFPHLNNASKIFIMGHRSPDFDSIGACIGMYTLIKNVFAARGIDKTVKIIIDTECENFLVSTERLVESGRYKHVFARASEALDSLDSNSLALIVDTNNLEIVEDPTLVNNCYQKAVIDHHIMKEEFGEEIKCSCVAHTASSTCELIAEMMEIALPPDVNFAEEATVMLSGIMLDTNNFTRNVGAGTFSAAMYLKTHGGSSELARTFFEENIDDYLSVSKFSASTDIYRDHIAIATYDSSGGVNSRTFAAKTADKLLSLKGINASFALVVIGDMVNISARSNGSINVQLIAEALGGGGHFDMAGAAISGVSLDEAKQALISAIDAYFARDNQSAN